jgi:hypothetical protein
VRVDAETRFLEALRGETDPERKRKIIGRLFIEVFEEQAHKLQGVRWLAQGTIYPDVIESAGTRTGKAHVIKSHHNVGGLPEQMKLKLVEPLRELFKDEVRRIGLELGLPREMVFRHPFPGPGLGVRILGEVTNRTPTCCARRTGSSSTSCTHTASTTRQRRRSRCSCRYGPWRSWGRPPLRLRDRAASGRDRRFHDRALGAAAVRISRALLAAHHQRGAGHLARHLRHFEQAAGHDRSGSDATLIGKEDPAAA